MPNQLCQSLLRTSPIMLMHWDSERVILESSGGKGHFDNLALTANSDYSVLIHPDDEPRVSALSNEQELDICYRLVDSNGLEYFVREYSHLRPITMNSKTTTDDNDFNQQSVFSREGILILQEESSTEAQMAHVQERLRKCEKELQDFAYIASHDLQEPLRKVQAFGDRLNQKCANELGDKGQDYLARMLNATQRLQEFLHALLEYSRVSTKGKPATTCDLNIICSEVVSRLHKNIDNLHANIAIAELPVIQADHAQIRQLFQHLLENSLKFYIEGVRPIIAILAKVNKGFVEIQIKDNGIGFGQENAEKAFQIFHRLHGRTQYAGSGIGLSVCRKIAERHGGNIHVQSTQGNGATFILSLPIHSKIEELVS